MGIEKIETVTAIFRQNLQESEVEYEYASRQKVPHEPHGTKAFRRMPSCRLCGFRGPVGASVQQFQCPVCGKSYDTSDTEDGDVAGSQLPRGGGVAYGTPQQPRFGAQGLMRTDSASAAPSSCLNVELQSLLQLIPEQLKRRTGAQCIVRSAGSLPPAPANDALSDPDVVYIRPRIDPTMRVLKVRLPLPNSSSGSFWCASIHQHQAPDTVESDLRNPQARVPLVQQCCTFSCPAVLQWCRFPPILRPSSPRALSS